MPELNWDTFRALPGDARGNFERLCRASAFHAYHRYGRFAATAQQPGVEFHLNIDQQGCSLGDPGCWYGWQCKWCDLPSGTAIGANRKDDVMDSINATKRYLPEITDWVLWTRRPLTRSDQDWFYGLDVGMRLHLWTEDNLDQLLVGDAALLREAYFGDLILTPDRLAGAHQRGGLLRRLERVKEALITYRAGAYVEQGSKLTTTYNRANAIKLALLTGESTLTDEDEHLRELREVLEEQLRSNEEAADDAWLWADLGDCLLLLGDVDGGERAYQIFVSKAETRSPITTLAVLLEVASALKGHADPQASRVSEGVSRVAATFSS
jgi:tetratricopeptide (TPR) repeat protein